MPWIDVIWIEGPEGNIEHIASHGVSTEEVRYVLENPVSSGTSRTSKLPIAFGYTKAGRFLAVVYEQVDNVSVCPITAYEIEESHG